MKTRKVRVRRGLSVGAALGWMLLTLAAWAALVLLRGDPVQAVLEARDERRVRERVDMEALAVYAVRTASCDSQQAARSEAARLSARGAAGYILAGETQHVLCAGYETQTQAESVRDRLREEEGMACDVVGLVSSGVSFYVTATPSQIEALTECEGRLRAAEGLLGALPLALDGGESSRAQVLDALMEEQRRLEAAASALENAVGSGEEAVCGPLLELSGEAIEDLWSLRADSGALPDMLFSGRLKEAFLRLRIGHIDWLETLGG